LLLLPPVVGEAQVVVHWDAFLRILRLSGGQSHKRE